MFRLIRVSYIFILLASFNGCASLWKISTNGNFKRDINKIINLHEFDDTNCNLSFGSRMGTCLFDATPLFVEQLINSLELQKYDQDFNINKIKDSIVIPVVETRYSSVHLRANLS